MQVVRSYYNSSNLIRIDRIYMRLRVNYSSIVRHQGQAPSVSYIRSLTTTIVNATSVTRTVDAIEVLGDYTAAETSSGDYTWVTKTNGDGSIIRLDMSDLPGIGDTV